MGRTSTRISRVMDRRFAVGVLLLALASTTTFLASLHLSRTESHRAEAIALVAGQRALSQRIAFLVSALDERPSSAMSAELASAARQMARGHDLLTLREAHPGDLERFLEPIQGVYFAGYMPFDLGARRFIADAERLAQMDPAGAGWAAEATRRASMVSVGTDQMMQTHDLMVRIMEADAEAAVARAQRMDVALWGFVLILLGVLTIGIYGPLRRHVTRGLRDLETAEARANEAARAAAAANEAKGHFLRAASHELKTPLNAITGFADVLGEGAGEDEALGQMRLASAHLTVLLDAILDTHRLVEGTLTLTDEPFEPAGVLEAIADLAAALAARKGLRFEADIDVDPDLVVRGDGGRLRQLCLNLIDNAVKFTEAGTVRLEAVAARTEDGARLEVRVADTGRGIAPEMLGAVFERFNANGDVMARDGRGLGLGLALTQQLAALMGGEVLLSSLPGKGTHAALVITRPVVERADRTGTQAGEAEQASRPPRVLIVDDNAPNRMVADALVRANGGLTVMAADGAQAVEAAAAASGGGQPFDLVLMDVSMPVMDGIEATKAIRASKGAGANVPIVAVTAHVAASDVPGMLAQGFDEVIHKPISKELIAGAVARWATGSMREAS